MNSTKNIKPLQLFVPIIYFIILILFEQETYILPNLIMSVSLYITLTYIYDYSCSIFSMSNIICIIGLIIGFFMRYLICIIDPSRLTDFAPYPLEASYIGHLETAVLLFVFLVLFSIGTLVKSNNKEGQINDKDPFYFAYSSKVTIIYFILFGIFELYSFRNINSSIELSYGTYDQLFRLVGYVLKIFAYAYLYHYSIERKPKSLVLYLMYLGPAMALAFIQAWKGSILIEILVLCIVFQTGLKKIKKRYIILIAIALFVVFPVISMIREYYKYGVSLNYGFAAIMNYNSKHNVWDYYLNRFSYYDGTYYVANVAKSIILQYKQEAGSIISRFFSGMIPRALWPGKPVVNVGKYVTYTLLRYPSTTYNNLTVGLLADAYLDASVVGIIIIGFLYGLLVSRNEKRKESNNLISISYYIVMGQALYSFLEGDIASKLLGVIFVVIAMAMCNAFIYGKIYITKFGYNK